jgi:hypothetical protein
MAKRTAARARTDGQPNPRQPCPCGSGKRYKACHGAAGAGPIVTRPFEGLASECELIALREFVPSASAPLPLAGEPGRQVTLATVLPMAAAAMVREDGSALVGMQVQTSSVDLSRDLARAIEWTLTAKPGAALPALGPDNGAGTSRLQDVLRAGEPLAVTLYKDFAWWVPEDEKPSGEVELSLERANSVILPTERIDAPGVEAAYWSVFRGGKAHLRWVRPEPEDQLLVALARLGAGGGLDLGEGSRYAGSLRAHGLLVPVWDLDIDRHAREWHEPAARFATRLSEAMSAELSAVPLTDAERRALQGIRARQLTLR